MDFFPLAIFPASSLGDSIIPVVWVGMFVVCFFNLRLGWALSGLVVPGYVVPLILIKPWSAGVIMVESILTYFLVWFFSEYSSRWAPWSNFFGRDRFFALVLCSVFVRLLFDGWLLPELGEWLNQTLQINFDYRNHLHSFGLIIIALIANQFWKTGLVRGIVPMTVIFVVTLLIVRYGLMEFSNFGLSNVSYLYEDMASSILATPKAYIILISTAFIASRMSLHYGWDFNGILIPSLLALQWYQPVKILMTLVETGIILLLAIWLLKTPWLSKMSIEGARKLLLFFNVGFAYKIALGYVLAAWYPEAKVTDYFGFGYLLSTLMAVKIHDKDIFARLTRATLQTSLVSVLFASIVGYVLTLVPISRFFLPPMSEYRMQSIENQQFEEDIFILLKKQEVRLYQAKVNNSFKMPLAFEIDSFVQAINLLQSYMKDTDPIKFQQAAGYLGRINYSLDVVQNRYLYLHEKSPLKGWGIYVFDMHNPLSLAISAPAPLDERGIFDASITLFQTLDAGSLAISGSSRRAKADLTADVLHNRQTLFHQFHRLVNRHNSIQVRGYDAQMARQIAGSRRSDSDFEIIGLETLLWVKQNLPSDLDLVKLKKLIKHYQIEWSEPAFENQQRQLSGNGFAELILTQQDLKQLLIESLLIDQQIDYVERELRIEGYLQEWILNSKTLLAAKGSELYQVSKPEELLFLDEQVLTPLLKLLSKYAIGGGWATSDKEELQIIAQAAHVMGYLLIHYKNSETGQKYLILNEQNKATKRYWGTYVFRLGQADNYLVQIPRPLFEANSFEYGVTLFEDIKAKVLMISTAHPHANLDGSSDLIAPSNVVNMFNLVNQVTLREHDNIDMLVVSNRAFSYKSDQVVPKADMLFAVSKGLINMQQLQVLEEKLLKKLEADGMTVQLVDGSEETLGYEVGGTSLAQYLNATENKNFVTLWVSPLVRARYRQQDNNIWQVVQFNALEVETVEQSLSNYIQQTGFVDQPKNIRSLKSLILEYTDNPDIIRLQMVLINAEKYHYQLKRLVDTASKQAFLLILNVRGKLIAVANLLPRDRTVKLIDSSNGLKQQSIKFIDQRSAWLQAGVK